MATNLATILVGLGYDLSALEKGAPEAYRLINSQTASMSAEMKRNSREGAESLRLIDEALGIHISRPVTRILTREFPALASGLSSLLGAGVGGAIAIAGFEFIERGVAKIEAAKQKQEELGKASENTQRVIEEGSDHYAHAMEEIRARLAAVAGDPGPLKAIENLKQLAANTDDARKRVDQLAEALQKEAKAAEEAGSLSTRAWSFVGSIPGNLLAGAAAIPHMQGSPAARVQEWTEQKQRAEDLKSVFASMKDNIDAAFRMDSLKGTNSALDLLNADLKTANFELSYMAQHGNEAGIALADSAVRFLTQAREWAQAVKDINDQTKKLQQAEDAKAAMEKERAEIQAQDAAITNWAKRLLDLHAAMGPPKDAAAQLNAELQKQIISFTNLERILGPADFYLKFHENLQQVIADLGAAAAAKDKIPDISGSIRPGAGPTFAGPSVSPILGAGGTAEGQFAAFQADAQAQTRLANQAFADILTPAQKYELTMKELGFVLKDANGQFRAGEEGQAAYAAAAQKAREELAREEQQIVKAKDGLRSWMQGLSDNTNAGRFTFDMLTKGLQGFEDETVKAITGGKTSWLQYFTSLEQMALKFFLNKELTAGISAFSGSGIGKSLGLGGLTGGGGQEAAAATQLSAGTIMQTAATMQMTAAQMWASSGVGGAAGQGSPSSLLFGLIPGFAGGTDSAPGGAAWVGEQGPELVNLPSGASVTPNSMLRAGNTVHIHIDAKGAEIGVEEKIARAFTENAPRMIMQAVAEVTEVQRRTPH